MPESNNIFYPSVKDIVSFDNLPASLSFVEQGLDTILEHIYFKDFVVHKTFYREFGEYRLTAIIFEDVGISFPGTDGLKLLLNPGTLQDSLEIPIIFNYYWNIIRYKNQFSFNSFDNAINSIIEILFDIAGTTKEAFLLDAIDAFIPQNDSIGEFVNLFNSEYVETLSLTDSEDYFLSSDEIVNFLGQNNYDIINVVVTILINNEDYSFDELFDRVKNLFERYFGELTKEKFYEILIPQFNFEIENIDLALQFPRKWLRPIYTGAADYPEVDPATIEIGEVLPEPYHSRLIYNVGRFKISSKKGFEFFDEDSFDFKRSEIGKTGLQVEFSNLKLDLRKDRNIPEASADGRSDDFRGVYAELAAVTLPKKWFNNVDNSTLRIAGYNMLIGTGGVSGTVAIETVNGTPNTNDDYMPVNIGNWELGFKNFDMTFKQNSIIESNIEGRLKIPKLKDGDGNEALIDIKGHLNEEGDFNLTASEEQGIPLSLFDFVTINFLTLELGREDEKFYVGTSCEVTFQNAIMQRVLGDQKIVLPKLRVYEDGSMEIVGGNAFIPTNISLNLGPIEIAVTGIHFGSHQQEKDGVMRKYNYWGFDGAISLDPLGIDARGEGIKYYYTTDNDEMAAQFGGNEDDYKDNFLRIQTIEVDLIIPGTANPDSALAIINGMLSIPEPGESPEYEGKIGLKLPKARISGAAQMRLQPKEPAFIIEAGIEMPTPIPLAATGLAFYGFGGLLGYKYVAEKEAIGLVSGENTWYEYYTYPKRGVNLDKFSGPPRTNQYNLPVAVGAGTVLGTMHDDGFLFSTRLMAILSLPSVFILDGRANVLGERLGILDDTEPPFFAGVAVGDNSFEFWFGADYQLPKSNGWIIDLYAEVQAGFFFNNPSAWYLNFGTKQSPITARVLTIITAQSYLMLSARGIEAGARVDLSLKKNFFGIKVEISAYVEVGGFISFERFQLGGYIAFGGTISISVWKIVGFRVSLDAILSAEAAKPFLLYAEVRVRVCIRIIVKICKTFKVKLKWEKDNSVDRTPIPPLANGDNPNYPDRTEEAVQGVHMLTNETFALNYFPNEPAPSEIDKVIPLDTYIDFKAMKGLVPGAISDKIGGHTGAAENFIDLIPPNKVVRGGKEVRQVKHKYSIENIGIYMADGSNWRPYHPFEAVVPVAERPNVDHLRIGYWQRNGEQYDSIRLLATNPFSYMEAGEPGWFIPEQYGITPSELYCVSKLETGDCSDVLEKALGTKYYRPNGYIGHYIDGAYYSIEEGTGDLEETIYVQDMNWSIPMTHASNGENVDTVFFDRLRVFLNGSNQYFDLGVSTLIYTDANGIAADVITLAGEYLTEINTLLLNNNSEPLRSFEFTNVAVENGNLNVSVRVKSDYEFATSGANAQIFSTLYLSRSYGGSGSSSLGTPIRTTETIVTSSNEPTPVGCMEVTDVANNFNYAQSLQFSNADTLVIILPVATVNTDLKLTTYAEGVTIRYYKTLLSDTANTPQYQLVHEVYKTRAELSNVVSYTNEDDLITRITVTPKSANAHLIRAVREEIAELQEATYDSETGQIIPLTAEQQAQLAALQAELAQLEAQGCSQAQSELPSKTSGGSKEVKSAPVSSTIFNSYYYTAPQAKGQLSNAYTKMKHIGDSYYAVGYPLFNVVGSSDTDGVLTKLDAAGKVMFSKVYFIDNQPIKFLDIHGLSDGNILIIASLLGEKLFYIKVDTDGRILWQRYVICEQGLDEHRVSVVKTRRQSFFITCLSTKREQVFVFEIAESGELINQTGLEGDGKYTYEIGASCLDPDGGLLAGIRRRRTEKSDKNQSMIVHFDGGLRFLENHLINSESEIEITDMLIHEDRLYFILDNISTSESTISYLSYNGKEFKELSTRVLPAFKDWKLTGSDKPNTVIVAHNETPVYRIGIQADQSLAIDTMFDFNTTNPIKGISDILYNGERKEYTFITDTYLAVLGEDLESCVTIKDERIKELPARVFTYTKIDAQVKDFKQQPYVDGSIRDVEQNLQLEEELCNGGGNGDCNKDETLCNFYETLQAALFGCIDYRAKDPFNDNWNCFLDMIKSIEEFDALYPQYELIKLLEADINTLLAYPEFARPPILEGAIGYANVILDKIYEIGKCDCPGDGTEVPVVCNTSLQQVCWLSVEKFEYNQTIPGLPALEQEQQDMEEAVQYTAQPIWRPNSTFYVHYQLKDEVDNGAGGDTFDYYYGFKTAGPIGHFHNADGVTYGNEYDENDNLINRVDSNGNPSAAGKLTNPDKYPLTSLRQYIDYDKSYPNADGNLLQAKPVFYGQEQCRITLYFTKPLAYHMLRSWESYLGSDSLTGAMHIAIKDPVSDVTIPYPLPIDYNEDSVPLPEGNGEGGVPWIDDNDPRIPLNIRLLNNFINYINENNDAIECTFTVGNAIQPQSYAYSVTLTNLKPQKLYTALIYNAFETESNDVVSSAQVHNYVFQTSRYQNFEAQVNSYLLVDEDDTNNTRQAVFNVALPNLTPSDIDTAYNIVDGNPDANSDVLETQYLDVFDRLLEGVLGMQPLDPAVNTEFNKILDGDGNIIAILIRNPEPFNIPKIPIAQINGTEEIFEAGSTVGHRGAIRVFDKVTDVDDDAYKVLYSKDYSQAIIMHESKQITADTLSFKFRYLIWDVNTYVIDDTARAEDIVLAQ
jgi:hypothetical protein